MALRSALVMLVAALALLVSVLRAPDLQLALLHAPAVLKVHLAEAVTDRAISPSAELTKGSAPRGDRYAPPAIGAVRPGSAFIAAQFEVPSLPELPLDPPTRSRARLMVFLN